VYAVQQLPAMPMRSLMVPKRSFLPHSNAAMSVLLGFPLSDHA
jgi:hypothetical protein